MTRLRTVGGALALGAALLLTCYTPAEAGRKPCVPPCCDGAGSPLAAGHAASPFQTALPEPPITLCCVDNVLVPPNNGGSGSGCAQYPWSCYMKSCGNARARTTTDTLQGSVAFLGGGPELPFTFDLLVDGKLVPLMIDTKKPYGEYAVRLVLMAYEKGLTLRVVRDLDHQSWAIAVFI